MEQIVYKGYRVVPEDSTVSDVRVSVTRDGIQESLEHFNAHSPTGYNWGYAGSGPADMAVAILRDFLGETFTREEWRWGKCRTWELHHQFKVDFVVSWDDEWRLTGEEIQAWIEAQEAA